MRSPSARLPRCAALGAAALALAVTAAPRQARADDLGCGFAALIGGAAGAVFGIGALTSAIGTGATLGETPPPVGWRTAGWVFGTLNLWPSAAWLATADGCGALALAAIPQVTLTALDFGLSGAAMSRADEEADAEGSLPASPTRAPAFTLGWTF